MKLHHFDRLGFYTHSEDVEEGADRPDATTDIGPPKVTTDGHAAQWQGGYWLIVKDTRPAPPRQPSAAEQRAAALARLQAIDAESARPLRDIMLATVAGTYAPIVSRQRLERLEAEADALRSELKALSE